MERFNSSSVSSSISKPLKMVGIAALVALLFILYYIYQKWTG